ncbi:MAG: hypothetical protein AABX23_03275 [Nanoarchaeota archaeon]
MNRGGNIAVILTPFLAFILIILALFNMITFNGDIYDQKANLQILTSKSEASHRLFEESLKEIVLLSITDSKDSTDFLTSFNESLKRLGLEKRLSGLNTNLYAKISLGDYSIEQTALGYKLVVSDVFEDYVVSNNEMRYSYSKVILFDVDVVSINEIIEQDL